MFVAHIFAGYLCTRQTIHRSVDCWHEPDQWKKYMVFGLVCSVLPDFDLLYFYLIDHRQHIHHSYWTHIPIFWIVFVSVGSAVSRWIFQKRRGIWWIILFVNTWLHLILDTVAGGIYWFYPVTVERIRWIPITPQYDWWVLNYLLHWTFLFEVIIILTAIYVYRKDHARQIAKTLCE